MEEIRNVEQLLEKLNLAETLKIDGQNKDIHGFCLKLESKKMINYEIENVITLVLTKEGTEILKKGSPEYNLAKDVSAGIKTETKGFAVSHALKNKWVEIQDGTLKLRMMPGEDKIQKLLQLVNGQLTEDKRLTNDKRLTEDKRLTQEDVKTLKKRKLVAEEKSRVYLIRKGEAFSTEIAALETELTTEMLQDGSYGTRPFKEYNFDTLGKTEGRGALHPLMKVRAEMRDIFLEMGFEEMETGKYVESSFWNFDALFQPQSHPSREMHDTFFLAEESKDLPLDYVAEVKKVHEGGHHGSIGYQNGWEEAEARKSVLRTHTTAASARYLHALAGDYSPRKYFSVDRVFRNESVDATHLAEFHQIEGLIVDRGLTLGHLKGVLRKFFTKLGLPHIKFKPAFNPYTEPSMEVFAYHEGMGRWIEVGNSGIFRPEMLLPMGFDKDVRVIAWGLSLERPTMIKYGIKNIRELIGHKIDINSIRDNEICIFK